MKCLNVFWFITLFGEMTNDKPFKFYRCTTLRAFILMRSVYKPFDNYLYIWKICAIPCLYIQTRESLFTSHNLLEEEKTNWIKNVLQFNKNLLAHQRCITLLHDSRINTNIWRPKKATTTKCGQRLVLCRLANNFWLKYIFWKTW